MTETPKIFEQSRTSFSTAVGGTTNSKSNPATAITPSSHVISGNGRKIKLTFKVAADVQAVITE